MWRGLAGLVLVVSWHRAIAEPIASKNAPRACKPAGGVLFEIDQRAAAKSKLTTATTVLYGNGSWKTRVLDVDGKLARTETGCLEPSQLDGIRSDLRSAAFKTTRTTRECRADQPRFTVYKRQGKLVYTERTCNVFLLDEASQGLIDRIATLLWVPSDLDGASLPRPRGSVNQGCLDNPLARGCD